MYLKSYIFIIVTYTVDFPGQHSRRCRGIKPFTDIRRGPVPAEFFGVGPEHPEHAYRGPGLPWSMNVCVLNWSIPSARWKTRLSAGRWICQPIPRQADGTKQFILLFLTHIQRVYRLYFCFKGNIGLVKFNRRWNIFIKLRQTQHGSFHGCTPKIGWDICLGSFAYLIFGDIVRCYRMILNNLKLSIFVDIPQFSYSCCCCCCTQC